VQLIHKKRRSRNSAYSRFKY